MNIEELRIFCLNKPGVTEGLPFGDNVLVYKVGGKMFLLLPLNESPIQFNVKCEPEKAVELRERYDCVQPGYHMSKKHWNTVVIDGSVKETEIFQWITDSYVLVFNSLSKKERLLV